MTDEVFDLVGGIIEEHPIATAVGTVTGLVVYKYIQHRMIMKGIEKTIKEVAKQQKKQKKNKKQKDETED